MKKIVLPTILALIGIFGAVVLAELVLQLLSFRQEDFVQRQLKREFEIATKTHPAYGWTFVPGIDTVWNYTGKEKSQILIPWRTLPIPGAEDFGMRDDGLNTTSEQVAVVLGDSFSFGATVRQEEIWCEQLERASSGRVDFLNISTGGGILKSVAQYRVLRDVLPAHEFVIYQLWLGNEYLDNYTHRERYAPTATNFTGYSLIDSLLQKSRLWHLVESYLLLVSANVSETSTNQGEYWPEHSFLVDDEVGALSVAPRNLIGVQNSLRGERDWRIEEGAKRTLTGLRQLKDLVGERTLLILIFPFKEQVYFERIKKHSDRIDIMRPNHEVLAACRQLHIPCFDITDELIQSSKRRIYWDYDPHFTETGQSVAARLTLPFLRSQGLLLPES